MTIEELTDTESRLQEILSKYRIDYRDYKKQNAKIEKAAKYQIDNAITQTDHLIRKHNEIWRLVIGDSNDGLARRELLDEFSHPDRFIEATTRLLKQIKTLKEESFPHSALDKMIKKHEDILDIIKKEFEHQKEIWKDVIADEKNIELKFIPRIIQTEFSKFETDADKSKSIGVLDGMKSKFLGSTIDYLISSIEHIGKDYDKELGRYFMHAVRVLIDNFPNKIKEVYERNKQRLE